MTKNVKVITISEFILVIFTLCILIAILLWGFLGSIPIYVHGKGILLPDSEAHSIASEGTGRVKKIFVTDGESLKENQIIAELDLDVFQFELDKQKEYVTFLNDQAKDISDLIQITTQQLDQSNSKTAQVLKEKVVGDQEYQEFLKNMLKQLDPLLKKGYITPVFYENFKYRSNNTANAIRGSLLDIEKIEATKQRELVDLKELLFHIQQALRVEEKNLHKIQKQYYSYRYIRAYTAGVITEVHVKKGDVVNKGTSIVNIINETKKYRIFSLFPANKGKEIRKNMSALSTPLYLNEYKYGLIEGEVFSITQYAQSRHGILSKIPNPAWLQGLEESNEPMLVAIVLPKENKDGSFIWTSSDGPKEKITPGTFFNIKVQVSTKSPISLFFPFMEKFI